MWQKWFLRLLNIVSENKNASGGKAASVSLCGHKYTQSAAINLLRKLKDFG
jgi:hypothetical protein